MIKKLFCYILGASIGLTVLLSAPMLVQAERQTLNYSDGAVYYGEIKNGKPHGEGRMTWGKSKTYNGSWVEGKRSGQGVYKTITQETDRISETQYEGTWKNDRKEGKGVLRVNEISLTGAMLESRVQTGTFSKDQWIDGYDVRKGEYDPPYYFAYKDAKIQLQILGEAGEILKGLKEGYFFSFKYQKGKVHKNVGVGDEYDPKAFRSFIVSIEKEIKPYIQQFEKLAKKL